MMVTQWLKKLFVGPKQAAEIDGAERVIVDSSALHCPICLGIFGTAPVILPCGHSFCGTCIRRLIENGSHISQDTLLSTYECALCKAKCSCDAKLVKNYVVEALLQSVCEIGLSDPVDVASNTRISLERSVKMVAEHEKEIYKLKRLVEEERKKSFMYISISFLFGTLLSLIFAVQVLDFFRLLW
ncbi:unnamed protein product [Enterobius vermicularis]|uniref:RING-type domain-containing protein n=1 Tax=Enterobius vermicularis TaxID=51028 RepID=A0A0N4V5Z0_ENTVE|nr:unnamed protein product [Enterobius vermicularis]